MILYTMHTDEHLNVGTASNPDNTESNLYSYDILLRNCFGTYFDILKEMTFNSKMGEQFNYVDSTSTRLQWDTSGTLVFPDESEYVGLITCPSSSLIQFSPTMIYHTNVGKYDRLCQRSDAAVHYRFA